MPRPCKSRRVCAMPGCRRFGPIGGGEEVSSQVEMTVDEFEVIRLIDLEEMNQEQCAAQMEVARTTVQAIYGSARRKLALCLVERRPLWIRGGEVTLCPGWAESCGRRCTRTFLNQKGEKIMKIAVTFENGQIFQHFGHTEQFKLYTIEQNKVVDTKLESAEGSGHGALAGMLKALGVDTLICGGIGGGAQTALAQAGIRLFGGVCGDADKAVNDLLEGKLAYNPEVKCEEHQHHGGQEGEHSCGSHGCGHSSCGK